MRIFSSEIALVKNKRDVYCLDTSMGCFSGMRYRNKGCYDDCYAARFSIARGFDFSKTVTRHFIDRYHATANV